MSDMPHVEARGLTWFASNREALAAVLLTVLVLLSVLANPAIAGAAPPPSGPVACSSMSGSQTLDAVRQASGADWAQSTLGLTGAGVGVAVIDTGVNAVAGLSGSGKVLDGPDLSFDAQRSAQRHRDLHGHGTNMAGIIAATGTPYGGNGIAPGARIVNVKVGAGDGAVDVSQVIAGIDWVVQNRNYRGANIRVISLAYGTDSAQPYQLDPLSHAVERAWKAGIVVVVAGGNDGRSVNRLANPAINPFVLAVGAAEQKSGGWRVPTWSSTGDGVRNPDLAAPGAAILSLGVAGSYLADTYPGATCTVNGAVMLRGSGTSQASAVVAGMAALLLEQRPGLTPDQVKHLLTSTATSINSNSTQAGAGRAVLATSNALKPGAAQAATPLLAVQAHLPSTGLGSLDAARGSFFVGAPGDQLRGEMTAFGGTWVPATWAASVSTAWTGQTFAANGSWTGGTWSGATWSGATWSGATWSGATWSGATWSGATWSGATWSGATWSGATWSGATWSGATWSGATWSGSTWS